MDEKNLIWNPFHKGYLENPYEQIRILREHNPIHKGINGCWMLFRYDDVKFLLTDPSFRVWETPEMVASKGKFLKGPGNFHALSSMLTKWLIFLDPPDHTHLRALIVKIWNAYAVRDKIQEVVRETLSHLSDKEEVDIVADYAVLIPTRLICRILGLPPEDYAMLRKWSYHLIHVLEPFESLHQLRELNRTAEEFHEYLMEVIWVKERRPDNFFISKFLAANDSLPRRLSHDEIVSTISLMFLAGIETSINLFSQTILLLIKNPRQAEFVRENEFLSIQATNELIRYITPTQYTKRVTMKDIEIRGVKIKAGEPVLGSLVSANHDPDVFDEPDKLDLKRCNNPHLSFGYGPHFCVGARLAIEELSVSIPALLRRYSSIALLNEKSYQWDSLIINRTLKSLHIILHQ